MSTFPLTEGWCFNPEHDIYNSVNYNDSVYSAYGKIYSHHRESCCNPGRALYDTRVDVITNYECGIQNNNPMNLVCPKINESRQNYTQIAKFSGGIRDVLVYKIVKDCGKYPYDVYYTPDAQNRSKTAARSSKIRNDLYTNMVSVVFPISEEHIVSYYASLVSGLSNGDKTTMEALYDVWKRIMVDPDVLKTLEHDMAQHLVSSEYITQYDFIGGCATLVETYADKVAMDLQRMISFKPYMGDPKNIMEYEWEFINSVLEKRGLDKKPREHYERLLTV